MNRIRDHIRRVGRRPQTDELDTQHEDDGPSPLEQAVGQEAVARYGAALARLSEADRELIVASIELGYNYEQLAEATGRRSADAARKAAGQPELAWMIEEVGAMEVELSACQTGMAMVGMTAPDIDASVKAIGLISFLSNIGPDDRVVVF
jgi:peroxiredoxin family protein